MQDLPKEISVHIFSFRDTRDHIRAELQRYQNLKSINICGFGHDEETEKIVDIFSVIQEMKSIKEIQFLNVAGFHKITEILHQNNPWEKLVFEDMNVPIDVLFRITRSCRSLKILYVKNYGYMRKNDLKFFLIHLGSHHRGMIEDLQLLKLTLVQNREMPFKPLLKQEVIEFLKSLSPILKLCLPNAKVIIEIGVSKMYCNRVFQIQS